MAFAARKWKETTMRIVIVRVETVDADGDPVGEIEIIDTEAGTVTEDGAIDEDIVEYYKRRLPLTVKAMGL